MHLIVNPYSDTAHYQRTQW